MEKTITITIEKANPAGCTLTMSDNGITEANPGDYVEWILGANSGIAQITGITVDQGSIDVFKPDPKPVDGSNKTKWKGRINPDITEIEQENYTIDWTTSGSGWLNEGAGAPCSTDPIIKVSPKNA
jgi:hypothetical protein